MPAISVIVPVYRVEPYIRRCIDSVLNQSFSDIDLILVDDGSPDNSGAICDGYARKDGRVHVIHRENGGLSAARNTGIDWVLENSDSEWITFLDSDDWIHSQMLEVLLDAVRSHGTKVGVCGFVQTHGEEPIVSMEDMKFSLWEPERFFTFNNVNAVIACGKLYHKSCFAEIRFPEGKIHEDEFTTYKILFAQSKIAVTSAPFYFYYYNPESISKSSWSPKRIDLIDALWEQTAYFRKHGFVAAYRQSATMCFVNLCDQRQKMEESALSPEEKKKLGCRFRRYVWKAFWDFKWECLLRHPWFLSEVFPPLYRIFKMVKKMISKVKTSEEGRK